MAALILFDNIYLCGRGENSCRDGYQCQLSVIRKGKIEDTRHLVFALIDLGTGRNGAKLRQFGMFLPFAG